MQSLCEAYWYPLYAFVRRRQHDPDAAADLTQGFFATLLEKQQLGRADPQRGRFRTFLLSALKNYLANEHDRAQAQKRGGFARLLRLDIEQAETRYRLEPAHEATAERLFERQWAIALLERVLNGLRGEYVAKGKGKMFDALKGLLTCADDAASYANVCAALEMSEGAARVTVHRLRKQFRQRLREAVADSVESESDVEDEIRGLFAALASPA